jgi:hypothetical protein
MNEIDNQKLIDMNYRLLTLLGMVTPLFLECKSSSPKSCHYKFDWFMDAINAVVYENKPIPPMPNKECK